MKLYQSIKNMLTNIFNEDAYDLLDRKVDEAVSMGSRSTAHPYLFEHDAFAVIPMFQKRFFVYVKMNNKYYVFGILLSKLAKKKLDEEFRNTSDGIGLEPDVVRQLVYKYHDDIALEAF